MSGVVREGLDTWWVPLSIASFLSVGGGNLGGKAELGLSLICSAASGRASLIQEVKSKERNQNAQLLSNLLQYLLSICGKNIATDVFFFFLNIWSS